jgi:uncharacterized protein with LGFP repeats
MNLVHNYFWRCPKCKRKGEIHMTEADAIRGLQITINRAHGNCKGQTGYVDKGKISRRAQRLMNVGYLLKHIEKVTADQQ